LFITPAVAGPFLAFTKFSSATLSLYTNDSVTVPKEVESPPTALPSLTLFASLSSATLFYVTVDESIAAV